LPARGAAIIQAYTAAMSDTVRSGDADVWSEWLLHRRHADNAAYGEVVTGVVSGFADRVLDAARLAPGMTLADIGSGEGLVAFRAIERIGPTLRVIATDISAPLLQYAAGIAAQRGIAAQLTFLECPADDLGGIADATVDVVTTRAVLAYVADKPKALREFHRILKPGGRISLAEPILQDEAFYARALRARLDQPGAAGNDRFLQLLHRWKAAQFPDTAEDCARSPLVNFSERDLVSQAKGAGFVDIHLELHIDVVTSPIRSWQVFIGTSPHPWAPSLGQILRERFTAEERGYFESVVRPLVESGRNITTDRAAWLQANKP
jgi:ubiquinone/menaquinone biosynthesis C-methylase UbiE